MSNSQLVLDAALQLPTDERARLAHGLLISLEGETPATVGDEWAEEIGRRLDDVRTGRVVPRDWSTIRDEIQAELELRTSP